ncbi:RNA polymerase sigma factor [Proteiniphilum sp. UBA1028]|jgi:RNA polymerase sigma factor (sigma-70 family)|uniref:RNA polymerase sigma factor n=1 Tax=Proteiniphilum sp. UBA1028 TaxID=1947251 RepID=UPI000E949A68|nr:sigma-70 family RNA polymerase sigma factor [Proteiniphilum sp. UBA1028]HBG58968.1 RNA polymerase subunit sigma-70 [Porphyromonadaceae bacterium]
MVDKEKIETIYTLYADKLFSYSLQLGFRKEQIMDAIHDVFCKLCLDANALENVENIKYYLYRSLRNKLVDLYRQEKQIPIHQSLDVEALPFTMSTKTVEEKYIIHEEEKAVVAKLQIMLASLSSRQREIIYLKYAQEYSYEEISQIMQIHQSSCRKLLHKAMQVLRKNYTHPKQP